ncbi:hypothetical protein EB796_022264 [Bugula neritina]|uniref:Sulfotransferase domain-containing protein n=1 Tax=Bugula neritina TaxID=10212 RepID=A0A7J7J0R1_BUGNE|nr:hypothetical protein EB796_022264 [Bugula neritina]
MFNSIIVMATREITLKFFKHCIYLVIYSLFRCCQLVSWWLTGVQSHLKSCRNGEDYESSAQLLKVWFHSSGRLLNFSLRHHFLSTHVNFVHPNYALQKHITLMTVTDKEAIFSIQGECDDVLNVRKWPFLNVGHPTTAKHLLIMPISSMIKLGEELGDPKAKVIWIYHTARCGSTAMSQVFNSLPDVVSISEPNCLFSLDMAFKEKYFKEKKGSWITSDEYQQIYKNAVRLLVKPYKRDANVFAVRSHGYATKADLHLIPKLFPQFIGIFMYRNVKEQAISLTRMTKGIFLHGECALAIIKSPILSRLFPNIRPSNLLSCSCSEPRHLEWLFKRENMIKSCDFINAVIQFSGACFHYKEVVAKGLPVVAVKYEHLQEDKTRLFKILFEHAGLEMTLERERLIDQALSEDSQKGTDADKKVMAGIKTEVTQKMIDEANYFLRYYGLPNWGEDILLPKTLGY